MRNLRETLGFWPRFVLDRGFSTPILREFFLKENIVFYLRIKKGKHLVWKNKQNCGETISAFKIGKHTKDAVVWLDEEQKQKLRLVVSPRPEGSDERWYILTNDFESTRNSVLDVYAHRFEIEEGFKDIKHLFNLNKFMIKKKRTFLILLWFKIIAFWLAYWCEQVVGMIKVKVNAKKKRSYVRGWWESFKREIQRPILIGIIGAG